MSANRMTYALVILTLIVVIFFTFQQAASAGAIARAGQSNNQAIQWDEAILRSHRGGMKPGLFLNGRSITASGVQAPIADRSYDAIEGLRAQRTSR